MTDLAGRKLGRSGLITGKTIKNNNPPTAAPTRPFASQSRSVPTAMVPIASGQHLLPQQLQGGISGQGRAIQEQSHQKNFMLPGKQLTW